MYVPRATRVWKGSDFVKRVREKEVHIVFDRPLIADMFESDERVDLDVGGQLFRTTRSTLCSVEGYFSCMFAGWMEANKQQSTIFIDRGKSICD